MEMNLPFNRLVCPKCAGDIRKPERKYKPDYMIAEVVVEGDAGLKRKVAIDVMRMKIEDVGNGLARGHVKARVPCINGDHEHEIDITDIYRAPQIHLEGNVRCPKGHKMALEKIDSWEYIDEAEYGGQILVSGTFHCPQCGGASGREILRVKAPDMREAQLAENIVLNLEAALPHRG